MEELKEFGAKVNNYYPIPVAKLIPSCGANTLCHLNHCALYTYMDSNVDMFCIAHPCNVFDGIHDHPYSICSAATILSEKLMDGIIL